MSKKKENQNLAILEGTGTNNIEEIHDYFVRERRENLIAQGIEIEMPERSPLPPEEKKQYWRNMEFQRIEAERTDRKDPFRVDQDGEGIYDGKEVEEDDGPLGEFWVPLVEVDA